MQSKIPNIADIGLEDFNKSSTHSVFYNLSLTENTNGFVTQLKNQNNKEKGNLVKNDNFEKKSKYHPSESFNQNISENSLKNFKSVNKEFDFVIPSLDSRTNSSLSVTKLLNNSKNVSKKSFDFFPGIQIEKAKFCKKNIFDQNVYVKYLKKKVQTENDTKKQHEKLKKLKKFEMTFNTPRTGKLNNNSFNYELSSNNENINDQVDENFEEEKYPSIIMPIKPSFKTKISKKQKSEPTINAKKMKPQNNNLHEVVKPACSTSQTREADRNKNSRKIIDLNLISNESVLSSHYMNQPIQKFADLKLNEKWPSSDMYKYTIQSNPWVRSFKEKSVDNEIKTNFNHVSIGEFRKSDFLVYLPSRTETKSSSLFFPNIKQISFQYCE